MIVDVKVPTPGESITEVEVSTWFVADGDWVSKNQDLGEIESDKATLTLTASESGQIRILVPEHTTVKVETVACTIDTSVAAPAGKSVTTKINEKKTENITSTPVTELKQEKQQVSDDLKVTPLARKIMEEHHLSVNEVSEGIRRIGKREVERYLEVPTSIETPNERTEHREKMSQLRKKLASRLVAVKNETAMLTTFNEADMSGINALRNKYQKAFVEKHGIKLGMMSFFTKAVSIALLEFPKVNSRIDGDEIVTPNFCDIGIAVQTPKGLMVPVLRDAHTLSLAEIEKGIAELALRGRNGKLTISEMEGGTFTITNGGVFGSMMSTPIINPPQSAILGMHNIIDRPVAVNGKVEIRPMMYLAVSYDHRLIDGKDSVGFLVRVKNLLESPWKMLISGSDPDKKLLDL
jgi:2-oxoglutarate dehydrogenase E2 component (dihydrolipoamide succinyltransferase)